MLVQELLTQGIPRVLENVVIRHKEFIDTQLRGKINEYKIACVQAVRVTNSKN